MKINREIRAPRVRLISSTGQLVGVVPLHEAVKLADEAGLDLVEVVATQNPPVCKILDYGKYRYDQTKKEKESKKSQHQIKVKEVKLKPNIDEHDLETKLRHAKEFLLKGNKVKLTCMFRGREMAHPEFGHKVMQKMCESLEEVSIVEAPPKMFGRLLTVVLAPGTRKKKEAPKSTPSL